MAKQNIVVLGAGYGGLKVTQRLNQYLGHSSQYQLMLINKHNFHMFMTQLHEHAVGSSKEYQLKVPLDEILKNTAVRFIKGWVDDIDLENKIVVVNHGEIKVPFKYLVVALGSEPEYFNIEGLKEHSVSLRSLHSAGKIRREIENILNQAAQMPPGKERKRMLTFVIGGGGFTGVEFAGELAEKLQKIKDQYGLKQSDYKIILIEGAPELLPGMPTDMADYTKETLQQMGVEVHTGELIKKVTADTVYLSSGKKIKYRTLLWAGGVRGNRVLAKSNFKTDARGRVPVNQYLQYVDDPNIYVVGDSASAKNPQTGCPVIPTAQAALQQGEICAYNIYADISGKNKKVYRPAVLGTLISIGSKKGLGKIKGFKLKGTAAVLLKDLIPIKYRYSLGGLKLLSKSYVNK